MLPYQPFPDPASPNQASLTWFPLACLPDSRMAVPLMLIRGPAARRCNTVCTCARAHQSRYTVATGQWRSRDDRSTGKGRARRAHRRPSQRHGAGSEACAGWRDVVPNKARPQDEAPSATRGEGGVGRPWSPFTTICTSSHWEQLAEGDWLRGDWPRERLIREPGSGKGRSGTG